jgi:hypothetical protein
MSMTLQGALERQLSSTASAETTRLADFYYAQTGRNLHDDASKIARGVVEELQNMCAAEADDTPPDPYNLDVLRASQATPESRFEGLYKAQRLLALADEATLNDDNEAEVRALAANWREVNADADAYAPPDAYQAALDRLRSAR